MRAESESGDEGSAQPPAGDDILRTVNFDEDQGPTESLHDLPQENTRTQAGQLAASGGKTIRLSSAPSYRPDSRVIDLRGHESQQQPYEHSAPVRFSAFPQKLDSPSRSPEILEVGEDVLKARRRKKKSGFPLLSADELLPSVTGLLKRMEDAAMNDNSSHTRSQPAIEKLKMLDEVEEACIHRDKQPLLLNEGLLGVLKCWIEPLSDGTLPNIKIRTTVLRILQKLPIDTADETDRTNLKKSKLGSRVMFLSRISDETQENRRMASELVQRWTRPIFEEARRYDEEERTQDAILARRRRKEAEKKEEEKNRALQPGQPGFGYSVMRPQPSRDYVRKPKSRIDANTITGNKRDPVIRNIDRYKRTQKKR